MRFPVRLALVTLVASLSYGAIADAAPNRKAHKRRKDDVTPSTFERVAIAARAEVEEETEEPVVEAQPVERDEPEEAPAKVRKHATTQAKKWHVAIGPNVWASSVDANVTVGGKTVSAGVGVLDLSKHARYAVPLLAEAQYGRFSVLADFMYGVIDVAGGKDVGPLMVKVDGSASSLNVDAFGGFRVYGDEQSLVSVDARGGMRYQRTAIAAAATLDGAPVTTYETVMASRDFLAGARVRVQPHRRFSIAGSFDFGLFGTSNRTWSAAADASIGITSRVLVSLGWRTLTVDSPLVNLVMRGPRAAVQVLF